MSPPRPEGIDLRLNDILAEIQELRTATVGTSYEAFASNWVLRRAAERAIEIISEASRSIPLEFKELEPEIPWRQIAGIGNVLRHNYENISSRVVWDINRNHLDGLEKAVRRLLAAIETGAGQR
jgi:uncharacterized protein with HEPN domain